MSNNNNKFDVVLNEYLDLFPIDEEVKTKQEFLGSPSIISGLLSEDDEVRGYNLMKSFIVSLGKLTQSEYNASFSDSLEQIVRNNSLKNALPDYRTKRNAHFIALDKSVFKPNIKISFQRLSKKIVISCNFFYFNEFKWVDVIDFGDEKSIANEFALNWLLNVVYLNPVLTNDDFTGSHENDFFKKSYRLPIVEIVAKSEVGEWSSVALSYKDFYWQKFVHSKPKLSIKDSTVLFGLNSYDSFRFGMILSLVDVNQAEIKKALQDINPLITFEYEIVNK